MTNAASNKTVSNYLEQADSELTEWFEALQDFLLALGDDVQVKPLAKNFAFKRM